MVPVSVVIPFRDRIAWVREAVRSVLAQTHADFELLLVDDGSTESLEPFDALRDPRVRLLRQEPLGASAARNLGVANATGKYVAFLDSDDRFLPEKLAVQTKAMEAGGAAFSHTSYDQVDREGRHLDYVPSGRFHGRVYPQILQGCPVATPTVMVRRELLDRFRFDESVRVGEDVILWVQIARAAELIGIDRPLTEVRIHGSNAVFDRQAQFDANLRILRHAFREDPSLGFRFRRKTLGRFFRSCGWSSLEEGRKARALAFCLRALWQWPLDRDLPGLLVRTAAGEEGARVLKRLVRPR